MLERTLGSLQSTAIGQGLKQQILTMVLRFGFDAAKKLGLKDLPLDERRPCPIFTLSPEELQQFQHTSSDEVAAFLATLNYGPSKILINSFYLSLDKKTGVGTLLVRDELCRDHAGILRGVDSMEAIAQAAILHRYSRGELANIKPLFAGIQKARFLGIATTGAVLNILVQDSIAEEGFGSYGWILRGKTVLTEGEIYGAVTDVRKNLQDSLIKRANMLQQREQPLFPK